MDRPDYWPAMDLFSIASWSYAPSNLRHLRPPVPNDLGPHHDGSIFTFEDALEDLLAMVKGGALPDINMRYNQRRLLRQMYPGGEPMWFWLRRLESQGLLSGSRGFPHPWMLESDDFGSFGSDIIDQAFSRLQRPDWDNARDRFGRSAPEQRRRRLRSEDEPSDVERNEREYFDELAKTFRDTFYHSRGDSSRDYPDELDDEDPNKRDHHSQHRKLLPDTFEDLVSAISSGFEEGQKTWDTFMKTITDHHKNAPASAGGEKALQKASSHGETDREPGNKEVETRDEYVDRFGYLHTTVTRRTYDNDGNQIGSSTHFTMRPASCKKDTGKEKETEQDKDEWDADLDHDDDDVIDRTEDDGEDRHKQDRKQEKKPGWFWK